MRANARLTPLLRADRFSAIIESAKCLDGSSESVATSRRGRVPPWDELLPAPRWLGARHALCSDISQARTPYTTVQDSQTAARWCLISSNIPVLDRFMNSPLSSTR